MKITIQASDGKEFTGTDYKSLEEEYFCYRAELESKKQKEEAEKKAKEEKQKYLDQCRVKYLKEIDEATQNVQRLIETYEKLSGRKFVYTYDYELKRYVANDTRNTLDFAYDNDVIGSLLNAIRKM